MYTYIICIYMYVCICIYSPSGVYGERDTGGPGAPMRSVKESGNLGKKKSAWVEKGARIWVERAWWPKIV